VSQYNPTICFVTSNRKKLAETENILGYKLNQSELDIKEIQEIDIEKVVEEKAYFAYSMIHSAVLVEDTGVYIEAWNGFPGALIKWVIQSIGNDGLCNIMNDDNRLARVKSCVCLYNGKELKKFIGEIKGIIVEKPRGCNGFGWDSIFQPNGLMNKTYAEMSMEEKNQISMRRTAIIQAREFLEKNPEFLQNN
jgi:non-canonical purine NTP pyrophosphatase (RdgB/HAM1 family)